MKGQNFSVLGSSIHESHDHSSADICGSCAFTFFRRKKAKGKKKTVLA